MTRTIAKTYPNGATVVIVDMTPGEQLVSLREVFYEVFDNDGNFIRRFSAAFDASECANLCKDTTMKNSIIAQLRAQQLADALLLLHYVESEGAKAHHEGRVLRAWQGLKDAME